MKTFGEQLHNRYQTHSLIEFLLGDGARAGWLDRQFPQPVEPLDDSRN